MRSATIHFRARPDRLSLRAALGVWAALAIAGWAVVFVIGAIVGATVHMVPLP